MHVNPSNQLRACQVETYHNDHFEWSSRRDKIVDVLRRLNSNIVSLVELDDYESFFRPKMAEMGYDSAYKQRPRDSSHDGCGIFWKSDLLRCEASGSVDFADRWDVRRDCWSKDRTCLMVLLRFLIDDTPILVVNTHLARNPEDSRQEGLRMKQAGQLFVHITNFAKEHNVMDAVVVMAGDLNATNIHRIKNIAQAVFTIVDKPSHDWLWHATDVPSRATSITTSRNLRIDFLLYQANRLQLIETMQTPRLSHGSVIPNAEHPSDHLPIMAKFQIKGNQIQHEELGRAWYLAATGLSSAYLQVSQADLEAAFVLFNHDGTSTIRRVEFEATLTQLRVSPSATEMCRLSGIFADAEDGITFTRFKEVYTSGSRESLSSSLQEVFAFMSGDDSILSEVSPVELERSEISKFYSRLDIDQDG